MPQSNGPTTTAGWIAFFTTMISALENGEIAADQLTGKTLPEMAELTDKDWDKFDDAIEHAENTD